MTTGMVANALRTTQSIAAALLTVVAAGVQADDFPNKPIRLLVGTAPGGGTDFIARLLSQRFNDMWAQPVVVDNRPGATGLIAMEMAARAAPDGYTLFVFNIGHMMSAYLSRKAAIEPVRDFAPVSLIATGTSMLGVSPALQVKTVKELVALAKSRPGQIQYASGGTGGIQHLSTELLKREAGIDLVHIPYKGSGPGTLALVSGQVPIFFTNMLALVPHVKSGRVLGLALTGDKRSPVVPDVPTFAETGYPGVDVSLWQGMFAPVGTPKPTIDKLSSAIAGIVGTPEVRKLLASQGADPAGSTPAQFGQFVQKERDRWLSIVRAAKISTN